MNLETIKLFSAVHFLPQQNEITRKQIYAVNAEIAAFGYTMSPSLIDKMATLSQNTFLTYRNDLLSYLSDISGAAATHTRLFNNFPYDTPDQWDYLVNRIVGYIRSNFGLVNAPVMLSCGHAIDTAQFNLDDFGVCPICQRGVDELSSPSGEKYPYAQITPLKVIDYIDLDELQDRLNGLLARQSSLSADEKNFLALDEYRFMLVVPETLFRETVPFAFKILGRNVEAILPHIKSATDVMRIAYFLSDETNDLSLKDNAKFTLTTSERKTLLRLLDAYTQSRDAKTIASDMLRERERWLRLGETINPGTSKNRRRFPNTFEVFDLLRNDPKSIPSFNRTVETALRKSEITPALLASLKSRPGVFARRLDAFLRRATGDTTLSTVMERVAIIDAFSEVVDQVPTPLLLNMMKFYRSRNTLLDRVFFIKGARNSVHYSETDRVLLDPEITARVSAIIYKSLINRFKSPAPTGDVYIDPLLDDLVIPFNRRGDSSTISPIIKGSHYPFDGDVIRLFAYWVGAGIDVDLSASLLNADYEVVQTVAFTNLAEFGCTHSGDIQSAPKGASEFIDIDIQKLTSNDIRYVAMTVNVFRGQTFDKFPCFAGFMERDSLTSGAVYQPETVKLKFDITAVTTMANPLVFDLEKRKVVFTDVTNGTRNFGVVGRETKKQSAMVRAAMSIPMRKPTFGDVAELLVRCNGNLVRTRRDATVVWDESSMQTILDAAQIS